MRFVAFSSWIGMALIVGVLALIVLAYLLKPRRRQIAISSLTVWGKVLRQQGVVVSRWRWLLSLLLACVIAGALALALLRPEIPALGTSSQRVVIILDNAPSMATRTRDGGSRWTHAAAQARRLIARLGGGSDVMILDTMGRAPLAGFVTPHLAWDQIGALDVVPAGVPRLPEIPHGDDDLRIHVFSDGVGLGPLPRRMRAHSVFEPATNVALTAFEVRPHPGDATRIEGFVQVFNAMDRVVDTQVSVRGPDYAWSKKVAVAGGESANLTLDLSAVQAGIYRADLTAEHDALAADNVAFAVVANHHPRSVLLVTQGDAYLEDSLRALPGVRLSIVRPASYPKNTHYDAYVFDDFAPSPMPAGATLSIGTGHRGVAGEVSITRWDAAHPVTSGLSWQDLRIQRARLLPRGDGDWLVRALPRKGEEGELISAGEAGARWIRVGFSLSESNFHLQSAFPVFLGQALNWLTGTQEPLVRNVGAVTLPWRDAKVTDANGRPIFTTSTGAGTRFDALVPGVYTALAAGPERKIVANISDPDYARVNHSQWTAREQTGASRRTADFVARPELWTALLCLGALLMLLEWFTWTRKVTL